MTLEGLEREMELMRSDCSKKHSSISTDILEIKVLLARMDERQQQAFGQLGEGENLFEAQEKRLRKIEDQVLSWKGWAVGVSAVVPTLLAVVYFVGRLIINKLIKSL